MRPLKTLKRLYDEESHIVITEKGSPPRVLFAGVFPRHPYGDQSYDVAPDGRFLMARLVPGVRSPRTPGLANVIMQSMMVGSSHSRERLLEQDHADFYQNIHVHDVALLQFDSLEDARAWIDDDPYVTMGVFEKVSVKPFTMVLP